MIRVRFGLRLPFPLAKVGVFVRWIPEEAADAVETAFLILNRYLGRSGLFFERSPY